MAGKLGVMLVGAARALGRARAGSKSPLRGGCSAIQPSNSVHKAQNSEIRGRIQPVFGAGRPPAPTKPFAAWYALQMSPWLYQRGSSGSIDRAARVTWLAALHAWRRSGAVSRPSSNSLSSPLLQLLARCRPYNWLAGKLCEAAFCFCCHFLT